MSAQGRAECGPRPKEHLPPACPSHPSPRPPGGDWEVRTLGDSCRVSMARRSLSSSALSLASSLSSRTLAGDGKTLGQWGEGGEAVRCGGRGGLVKGHMRGVQWAAGQSTLCSRKGQAPGTGPGQAPRLRAFSEVCLRVSGGPSLLTLLTHLILP